MYCAGRYHLRFLIFNFKKKLIEIWFFQKCFIPLQSQTKNDASLAQLVEQLTLNQWVQGSNP